MGCSNSVGEQSQNQSTFIVDNQVLPLPPDIVNAYIDRVSIIMINKIKDKFQSQLKEHKTQIESIQFVQMFKNCSISDNRKKNLFYYFNNNVEQTLKINKFIEKYCILVKSDVQHFSQIVHKIYCRNVDSDKMSRQFFIEFENQCNSYIKPKLIVETQSFPLSWSHFFAITEQATDWEQLQKSFQIISVDQLPYKAFHEQLQMFTAMLFKAGSSYYIVSQTWFSQWQLLMQIRIFFYQYEDTDIKNSSYRSVKKQISIKRKESMNNRKKLLRSRLNSSKVYQSQNPKDLQSFQQPTQINMTDIEGQYFGQLKPFLNLDRDITIINKRMWQILENSLGSDQSFDRVAIDQDNIDFYPISIYLYQADCDGQLDFQYSQILRVNRRSSLNQFTDHLRQIHQQKQSRQEEYTFYYKNFGQLSFGCWTQQNQLEYIVQQQPRTIVVQVATSSKDKFVQKHQRQQFTENYFVGDKVLAYLSYQHRLVEAFVLGENRIKKQYRVHFIGFSYRYEKWVKSSDVKLLQHQDHQENRRNQDFQKESIFTGISNIGNTCFINSTLQSLASTSIFDQFFLKANFFEGKYPLSFMLSQIVRGLLLKQKFNILQFKKIINHKMPMFSGYNQHDAQQFLNLLLDNLDQQLKQKPNIIDQLFGGVMQSKFTCLQCKQVKTKEEKIHTISLPIPEFDFNYFVIIVFPVYSANVRRIVLRLHKNAKIAEYLSQIEQKSSVNRLNFNYVECQFSVPKKFRNQIIFQVNQDKKVTDLGLNSNVEIWAYQKLRSTTIDYRLKQKNINQVPGKIVQNGFYDFYSNEEEGRMGNSQSSQID